jgi:uracil-DNA glycosylase family 4
MAKLSKALLTIDPAHLGCDFCALKDEWEKLRTPRMPPCGNTASADILVMGEAPGSREDLEGEIFIGASGRLLRAALPAKTEHRLMFQNTVRCRPPGNRDPLPKEVYACSVFLEQDVENLPIKAILGTGNVPLHKWFPETSILKVHGTKFPVQLGQKVVWFFPIFHPAYVLRQNQDGGGGKVEGIFGTDIKRFFAEVDQWPKPVIYNLQPEMVRVPGSYAEARTLLAEMDDPIAVDLETTGLHPYQFDAKILTASFSDGNITISFSVDHPDGPTDWGLKLLLETVRSRLWIAHNANFELNWFRYFGGNEPFWPFEDTMALARLYHQRETLLSLEVLSRIHLGVNVKKIVNVDARKISSYSLEQVLQYNGLDTMATAPLWHLLHDKVDKTNYRRLLGAIDAVSGMELQGLPVNQETAQGFKTEWEDIATGKADVAKQFVEVEAFARDTGAEFNIGSPKQLAKILTDYSLIDLPLTAKGNRSTNKKVLGELAHSNSLVKTVLDWREATKLNATYIEHVLEIPQLYPDGMLHPGYTVLHTSTGRFSSVNPNIQNFPRRQHSEIRNMVEVPPGYVLIAFDYGQLEARILAMASKDHMLCSSILSGRDIHGDWRDNFLYLFSPWIEIAMQRERIPADVDEKTLLKVLRDRIKNQFVFASFYGSSAGSCAEAMGVPQSVMEDLAIQLWEEFPGVRRWQKQKRTEYETTGEMRTMTNRVRYQVLYKHNEPVNTPIQGTAADIVTDALNEMVELSRREKDPFLHPRIQVHDDLSFILPDSNDLEHYVETISSVLTKVRYPWQIVPLTIEAKIGTKWGELEEFAVFTGPYNR